MKLHLPILILLSTVSYQLLAIYPVFAQEPTPTVTPVSSVYSQGNPFEDFIKSLIGNKIPDTLGDVNKASLPYVVGESVESENVSFQTQDTEKENNKPLYDAASQYTVASSVRTPETTSTNVSDFFKNFLENLADLVGIRKVGNTQAEKLVNTQLPSNATEKLLSQGIQSAGGNLKVQDSNNQVLGITSQSREAMLVGLPILQCASLPFGFCDESNTPRWTTNVAVTPSQSSPANNINITPTPSSSNTTTGSTLNYSIPFYRTDPRTSEEIDQIMQNYYDRMERIVAPAVKKRWPDSLIDRWNEVYQKSLDKGWNPFFVLAIWIEETAASAVCSVEQRLNIDGTYDFGIVYKRENGNWKKVEKTYCNDSTETKLEKFHYQLERFLNLIDNIQPQTFEEFMCKYSEGTNAPCRFVENPGFPEHLHGVYKCLVYGTDCSSWYFGNLVL